MSYKAPVGGAADGEAGLRTRPQKCGRVQRDWDTSQQAFLK